MKAWLFLLTALLIIPRFAVAQETLEPSEWTTEQRCVTTFTEPPDGWTFDGVIFTFRQGDGVHALRADVAARYYVAFDGNTEFAGGGRLSPDGQWFAVPAGRKELTQSTLLDYYFFITEIRVYNTAPSHEIFRIPIMRRDRTVNSSTITPVVWLDNRHLLTEATPDGYWTERETYLIEPFAGTTTLYDEPTPSYRSRHTSDEIHIIDSVPADVRPENVFFSNEGTKLAYSPNSGAIQLADLQTRTITNTCIETPYSVAFSPNGRQLAFGLESAGYIYILDLEAWEAYRIDLAANDVIGWYPIS